MSWTDKSAVRAIKQIRDIFKVGTFVETGTFKGINAEVHSKHFKTVITCEKEKPFYEASKLRLSKYKNVVLVNEDSSQFLKRFNCDEMIIFYLDAHFYNPTLPIEKRFVILDELKTLKGRKNSIIIIHDFDNNLGHITYDGQPLNLELIKKDLLKVNPEFKFYTNELSSCDIVLPNKSDMKANGLKIDAETLDNLMYAWKEPRLTYRGILYCLPREEKINGLKAIH